MLGLKLRGSGWVRREGERGVCGPWYAMVRWGLDTGRLSINTGVRSSSSHGRETEQREVSCRIKEGIQGDRAF